MSKLFFTLISNLNGLLVITGLCQGSVLSPCCSLCINDMPVRVNHSEAYVFADDANFAYESQDL